MRYTLFTYVLHCRAVLPGWNNLSPLRASYKKKAEWLMQFMNEDDIEKHYNFFILHYCIIN